jgi:hypothetical protein
LIVVKICRTFRAKERESYAIATEFAKEWLSTISEKVNIVYFWTVHDVVETAHKL